MLRLFFLWIVACAAAMPAWAEIHVKAPHIDVRVKTVSYQDKQAKLIVDVTLDKEWKIYWRSAGDTGVSTNFVPLDSSQNIHKHQWFWPVPEREVETITEDYISESYIYKNAVQFPLLLEAVDGTKPIILRGHLDYAVCKDVCIPGQMDIALDIAPNTANTLQSQFDVLMNTIPKTADPTLIEDFYQTNQDGVVYLVTVLNTTSAGDVFVEGDDVAFYKPKILTHGTQTIYMHPVVFLSNQVSLDQLNLRWTLSSPPTEWYEPNAHVVSKVMPVEFSLGLIILFAIIGGLILNIMPCVLPVLSIKIIGLLKQHTHDRMHMRLCFLSSICGIMISFMVLAIVVIALQALGHQVGWGFHFQEPLFIISLIVILLFFAANLFGWFSISLPGFLGRLGGHSIEKSYMQHIMSGVLATILATPCTAPFLGTAVGFALARGASDIILIFIAMGLGLSMPYIVLSLYPRALAWLPKPGQWMLVVKILMGWSLVLSALWLIWVLSAQLGVMAAWVVLGLSCLKLCKLWWASHQGQWSNITKGLLVVLVGLIFLVPFSVSEKVVKHVEENVWVSWSEEAIAGAKREGRIVLVDITADWCLTCQFNKYRVLKDGNLLSWLKDNDVVLMRGDWTNKNEPIAHYLQSHQRFGVPFNVIYGPTYPDGIILSELLSIKGVKDAVEQQLGKR